MGSQYQIYSTVLLPTSIKNKMIRWDPGCLTDLRMYVELIYMYMYTHFVFPGVNCANLKAPFNSITLGK